MLVHTGRVWVTLRENLLKLLFVKLDDQSFSSTPKGLIIALLHNILIGGEERP